MENISIADRLLFFKTERYEYKKHHVFDVSGAPRPHFCMGLILSGRGIFRDAASGEKVEVTAGDIIFVPIGSRYVSEWFGDPTAEYISMHFIFGTPAAVSREQDFQLQKITLPDTAAVRADFEAALAGSTKEVAAHLLHQYSLRASKPFVPVHCAALPENLIESELFGHERGSFTGAHQRHIGLFESAHEGTLFLDEIGEIDLNTQVKLLRFLETKTIERIGGTQAIPLDIRLVCATNRDLKAEVAAGRFREDLYYRLNVIEIHLPPLRERKEDIPLLLNHYCSVFATENQCRPPELSSAALEALQTYNWPGNIRELRNFAENSVVMYRNNLIDVVDLDSRFVATEESSLSKMTQNELQLIKQTLQETGGNKSEAAKLLGIPRRTFYRKLEKMKGND